MILKNGWIVSCLAAAVAVGGGLVAWRGLQYRIAYSDTIEARRKTLRAAEYEADELALRLAGLRRERAAAEEEKSAQPRPTSRKPPDPMTSHNSAEAVAKSLQRFRTTLVLEYGAFYRRTRLTAAQIETLEKILTEHEGRLRDIRITALENKLRETDAAIAPLLREEKARADQEMRTALGPGIQEEFSRYRNELPARRAVARLASDLVLTEEPLTPAQTESFIHVLKRSDLSQRETDGQAWPWPDIIASAEKFLSPRQVNVLQQQAMVAQQAAAAKEIERLIEEAKASP